MSLWSKLNQPIGKGAQAKAETKAETKAESKAQSKAQSKARSKSHAKTSDARSEPDRARRGGDPQDRSQGPLPQGRRGRGARAGRHDRRPDGGGTATAVLDQPPVDLAPAPTAPVPVAASRKSGGTSALAAVNLLSPWVLEELAVRRLRMRFLAAGIALVVLVAGAYGVLWMHLNNTREELRGDDAVAAGLNKQIKDMGDVQSYVGDVTVRGKAVATAMGGEVAFSGVFVELRQSMPGGADLTGLTVTLPAEPLNTDEAPSENGDADTLVCDGADPFGSRVVVACIELTGTAQTRDQVSRLVEALASSDLFVEPFISTTTRSDNDDPATNGVEFTGTVGVSPEARSGRYDGLATATQEQNESGEESR